MAAEATTRAVVSPMVTTPFFRHPAATATGVSTVWELTGGRAMLALGNGGSVRRVVGRSPVAAPHELRDYLLATKAVLAGKSAQVEGFETEPLERVHPVPILVAADYPASLRLAGEHADGVITTVGMSVDRVEAKLAIMREAAEKAGRDPASIQVWGFSFISVHDDPADAVREIGAALASDVALRLKSPHIRKTIPAELLPAVEEIERRYDVWDFEVGGKNARLLEELGLTGLALDMTGLTGDVPQVAGQLKRLEAAGVTGVLAALPPLADPHNTLRGLSVAASL